ncbi:NAD-dependent epimerase/dehydratase family protein [Leifsonia shinshuensis]|uniref:NAD-dependent epimerase/dehydratase family protein n=1 Tax=Leifsonia shinshuensis TaxID=150026 RepID=UPI001F50CEB4|nr:NAD-dependent epimerase/dehydratase family protein [Leifsonia shinshuensis]MCI0157954.1 NAD-dependent epimerase/dehydratase family protein [Leifsonia shinshuensis]
MPRQPSSRRIVLVTGGSGFIAGHIIRQLLDSGHEVRATLRSLDREEATRSRLRAAGMTHEESLSFVAADLLGDAGWTEAVSGVEGVLHVASPVRPGAVDDEDDVIVPARKGTVRVVRAAREAGVPRVVLTSAFHAVGFGHPPLDRAFTEDDWSPLDGPGMDAYGRSKVLAERAAWEAVAGQGRTELVAMLPVAVVGPLIGGGISGANHLVRRVLTGGLPAYPDFAVPFVDVRDVAAAHIAALTADRAGGERFLLSAQEDAVPLAEVGAALRERLGDRADRVPPPTALLPDAAVRAAAEADPGMRPMAAELGYRKKVSTEKARRLLGFSPRPWQEAVTAAAESMLAAGA